MRAQSSNVTVCRIIYCMIIVYFCWFVVEAFGALESVKAAADLISPISGTVTKVNSLLQDDSEIINKDPYGQGEIWVW